MKNIFLSSKRIGYESFGSEYLSSLMVKMAMTGARFGTWGFEDEIVTPPSFN